ncbi:hypothetical protein ACFLT5_01720 [Chloroflexota bacterium]
MGELVAFNSYLMIALEGEEAVEDLVGKGLWRLVHGECFQACGQSQVSFRAGKAGLVGAQTSRGNRGRGEASRATDSCAKPLPAGAIGLLGQVAPGDASPLQPHVG